MFLVWRTFGYIEDGAVAPTDGYLEYDQPLPHRILAAVATAVGQAALDVDANWRAACELKPASPAWQSALNVCQRMYSEYRSGLLEHLLGAGFDDGGPLAFVADRERLVRAFHRRQLSRMHDAFEAAFYPIAYRVLSLTHYERALRDCHDGSVIWWRHPTAVSADGNPIRASRELLQVATAAAAMARRWFPTTAPHLPPSLPDDDSDAANIPAVDDFDPFADYSTDYAYDDY